jgi:hypothetical protein
MGKTEESREGLIDPSLNFQRVSRFVAGYLKAQKALNRFDGFSVAALRILSFAKYAPHAVRFQFWRGTALRKRFMN